MSEKIRLTQYSRGAGCGCKIAPAELEKILAGPHPSVAESSGAGKLLVGYDTKDDAAVYDVGGGKAIISTTDFFMPIVDDAFDFGRIAAANSLSDVYAMGGKPLMAIAILGWPIEKIAPEVAQQVLEGARNICAQAGIPLAGGHSIDSIEPIFGLAVTGEAEIKNVKKNSTAVEGCRLYLTKPLGVGILSTAHKRGLADEADFTAAVQQMSSLNSIGYELGKQGYVKAMTDVTGFGLLGHLIEMCEGSGVSAEIEYQQVPLMNNIRGYISKMIYPDGTMRNWKSYEKKVSGIGAESLFTLCDPQTSGGLLIAADPNYENELIFLSKKHQIDLKSFGVITAKNSILVAVK